MKQDMKIDFPLNLCGIGVDRNPTTYYLTISAILNLNNGSGEAVKIQEEILEGINSQSLIGSSIYKYPAHTIHFSIINFQGLSSGIDTEEVFKEERESYIGKINNILQQFDQRSISDKKIEFANIYTGGPNSERPNSIAIQAFPSKELHGFFQEVCAEFSKDTSLIPVKIKECKPDSNRFSVNIVRFFRELSPEEYDSIAQKVFLINQRSKKQCLFQIELKHISFVLSDNWLSNQNPELYYIKLK